MNHKEYLRNSFVIDFAYLLFLTSLMFIEKSVIYTVLEVFLTLIIRTQFSTYLEVLYLKQSVSRLNGFKQVDELIKEINDEN